MITEKLIFKIPYEIAPAPDDYDIIFGANYYDHFRAWDAGSLTLTGSLVDAAASLTGSGRNLVSSGIARPSLVTDAIIGKDTFEFDGVSEFMEVLASTTNYNFLHSSNGGCVIIVSRVADANPDNFQTLLTTVDLTSGSRGVYLGYDDRSSLIRNNRSNRLSYIGTGTTFSSSNLSSDNALLPQQYNSDITILDCANATAAERSRVIINGGTEIKNNVDTNTPTVGNATKNLTIGRRADLSQFYFKGTIAEIIIADTIPTSTQLAQVQARLTYDYSTFPIT